MVGPKVRSLFPSAKFNGFPSAHRECPQPPTISRATMAPTIGRRIQATIGQPQRPGPVTFQTAAAPQEPQGGGPATPAPDQYIIHRGECVWFTPKVSSRGWSRMQIIGCVLPNSWPLAFKYNDLQTPSRSAFHHTQIAQTFSSFAGEPLVLVCEVASPSMRNSHASSSGNKEHSMVLAPWVSINNPLIMCSLVLLGSGPLWANYP